METARNMRIIIAQNTQNSIPVDNMCVGLPIEKELLFSAQETGEDKPYRIIIFTDFFYDSVFN